MHLEATAIWAYKVGLHTLPGAALGQRRRSAWATEDPSSGIRRISVSHTSEGEVSRPLAHEDLALENSFPSKYPPPWPDFKKNPFTQFSMRQGQDGRPSADLRDRNRVERQVTETKYVFCVRTHIVL